MVGMKVGKKYIGLIIILLGAFSVQGQQTIQFSQYMFNGLAVNPAYAGYKEDWTLNLSSRLQWAGIEGSPKTNTIAIDGVTNAESKNIGLGLLVVNDRLGPENNSSVYANYAYRLRLDEEDTKRLSFGIAAGLTQYRIDGSKFSAVDVSDGLLVSGTQSTINADFRLGAYYSSSTFYAGASLLNLFPRTVSRSNIIFINQARALYVTAGVMVQLSGWLDWKPSVMIKEDFKGPTNADIASYLLLNKKFWLGAAYSTGVPFYNKANLQSNLAKSDAVTAMAQFSVSDFFRIGYAYDFTTSNLAGYQTGSHELSLSLTFRRKQPRIISPRYF
jgi:type IX secretion system PorP/SprF family membrane protein